MFAKPEALLKIVVGKQVAALDDQITALESGMSDCFIAGVACSLQDVDLDPDHPIVLRNALDSKKRIAVWCWWWQ
ncbi:hypothetical protein D1872_325490 [compost metagenome]